MKREISGVSGVLDDLLGGEPPKPESKHVVAETTPPETTPSEDRGSDIGTADPSPTSDSPVAVVRREPADRPVGKVKSRLGRPPGKRNGERQAEPKEKATLWLSAQVMADYRDWSWERKCNLGELVERALVEHQNRYRIAKGRAQADDETE